MTGLIEALSVGDVRLILRGFLTIIIALAFLPMALLFVGAAPQPQINRTSRITTKTIAGWSAFSTTARPQPTTAAIRVNAPATTNQRRRPNRHRRPSFRSNFTLTTAAGSHAAA